MRDKAYTVKAAAGTLHDERTRRGKYVIGSAMSQRKGKPLGAVP